MSWWWRPCCSPGTTGPTGGSEPWPLPRRGCTPAASSGPSTGRPLRLAAFSLASGALDAGWRPAADGPVHALRVGLSGTGVYGAGDGLGGQLGAWTTAGAAKFPTLQTDGGGQAIAVIGAEVYLGGHFGNICPGGTRPRLALFG